MTLSDDQLKRLRHHHADVDVDGLSIGRAFHDHDRWPAPADIWTEQGPSLGYRAGTVRPGSMEERGQEMLLQHSAREPRLCWRPHSIGEQGSYGSMVASRILPGMLGGFALLDGATDDAITNYAQTFGVLEVCSHRKPRSHSDDCRFMNAYGHDSGTATWSEPVEVWREWAGRAKALLGIVANHRRGDLGGIEDWRAVMGLPFTVIDPTPEDGEWQTAERFVWWRDEPENAPDNLMDIEQTEVTQVVNDWLKLGGARLRMRLGPNGYEGSTTAAGLFGALGLQLLLVLTRSEGISLCRGCSLPFTPSAKHRTYCVDCGEDTAAMNRRNKRNQRARDRDRLREGAGE